MKNLPAASKNVYPTTIENIKAIFLFYFPEASHSEINKLASELNDKRELACNQIEFITLAIVNNMEYLKGQFSGKGQYLSVYFTYAYDAYCTENVKGSRSRIEITNGLRALLLG